MVAVSIEDCEKLFHLPVELAANRLGVSRPTIARVMRANGYPRWPYRVVRAKIRRHTDPGPSLAITRVSAPKRPMSTGALSTRIAVSDAIEIVRNRRKGGRYRSGRYSGRRASRLDFNQQANVKNMGENKKDSPSDLEDKSSLLGRNNETKFQSSESTSTEVTAEVASRPNRRARGSIPEHQVSGKQKSSNDDATSNRMKKEQSQSDTNLTGTSSPNAYQRKPNSILLSLPIGIEERVASITRDANKRLIRSKETHSTAVVENHSIRSSSEANGRKRPNPSVSTLPSKKRIVKKINDAENSLRKHNIIAQTSNTTNSQPAIINAHDSHQSINLYLHSISLKDTDYLPSAEIIMAPGGAVPWMDMTRTEREILGVPNIADADWNMKWEIGKELEEAMEIYGGGSLIE